jgi:hypothetical protein
MRRIRCMRSPATATLWGGRRLRLGMSTLPRDWADTDAYWATGRHRPSQCGSEEP